MPTPTRRKAWTKRRKELEVAASRKAKRKRRPALIATTKADLDHPTMVGVLARCVGGLHSVGVDVFASGRHSDPRMNLTLADIKAQYPWLAEIGKVFR